MNTIEENQEPVNEESIYITEEEENNEVYNTDIENNEDYNVMNEKYGISAAEENNLGKDAMESEENDQYEESEERDQSMERPRISNYGTGVDRLEIIFDKNICTWTKLPILNNKREI